MVLVHVDSEVGSVHAFLQVGVIITTFCELQNVVRIQNFAG